MLAEQQKELNERLTEFDSKLRYQNQPKTKWVQREQVIYPYYSRTLCRNEFVIDLDPEDNATWEDII